MLLTLKVLNSDASLNNFIEIGSAKIARGADAKLILQLHQSDKKIRFIPSATTVITVDFKKSDQTTLTKTASFPFADDRSIIEIDLSDTETLTLISQKLIAKLVDGTDTDYAILDYGLQMVSLTAGC